MTDNQTEIFEHLESNVRSYCRVFPAVFQRANGAVMIDTDGKSYLDFFGAAGSLNYGHNPPAAKRKLLEYIEQDGITHALDSYTSAKAAFLEAFQRVVLAPRKLDHKVQFCGPTGTNAVEAALKLARKVTGRTGVIAFSGAYHGMTLGSISVTSSRSVRASAGVPLANTTFVPFPVGPTGAFDTLSYLERLMADPHSGVDVPAAIILESVQMDGGVYVAPVPFLTGLRTFCDRHGVVLIVDDIQVGCGRSGAFFSFERAGIAPDLVTLSKSISGYGLPMSLLLIRRDLDKWSPGEHTGTFRGHQLAFITAAAVLPFWEEPSFVARIQERGEQMRTLLQERLKREPGLELRGLGMVYGVDFANAGGPERASRVQAAAFQHGLVIESCGRRDSVIKLLPPLNIPAEQLAEGLQRFGRALEAA